MRQMRLTELVSDDSSSAGAPDQGDSGFLRGSIERVVHFQEDSGQCVLEVLLNNGKERLLVGGHAADVHPGQSVEIKLSESSVPGAGVRQASRLKADWPSSEKALRKFLRSGALPGVEGHLATVLARAFPSRELPEILEHAPARLLQVPGIGPQKRQRISRGWREFRDRHELADFLFREGLPLSWARTLSRRSSAAEVIESLRERPYDLAREQGLDFEIIDAFALRQGHAADSLPRLRTGLHHLLNEFCQQGHCACPEEKLLSQAAETLSAPVDLLDEALEMEILAGAFLLEDIAGVPCVYPRGIWELEREVAAQLRAFRERPAPWGWVDSPKFLQWAQHLLNIRLAPLQKEAIETALSSPLTVITGGPGTGKTTLIRSLVTILQAQFARFALCTPTGRAAQRLEEATAVPATTIHRLLRYNGLTGAFHFRRGNPLNVDLVLVDEVSMVDLELMSRLLEALPPHAALVLVGDADQIPSIGAGSVLQSLIASGVFSTVRLTEIFRQSHESRIRLNARRINEGLMPLEDDDGDFHYLPVRGVEESKKVLLDLVTRVIPGQYGIRDPSQFQILVPLNKGALGAQRLNEELQQALGPTARPPAAGGGLETVAGFGQSFRGGDKVMVTRNDYGKGVFNGDIGFIQAIDHRARKVEVHFDARSVVFHFEELGNLTLAYAISVHKAQGSEYRAVIVLLHREHLPLAQRHLIYTAVTRGKEQVFLVADPDALRIAVASDENSRRWQKLTELLKQ
ncbi:MAG: AAA family ATPase [Bdellovibrionaceae bacterium]|nr:AAA family ATPase [Pseudobdellovibrionaceae bacterium]